VSATKYERAQLHRIRLAYARELVDFFLLGFFSRATFKARLRRVLELQRDRRPR
jgi:hypothetical protein